jgi:hypothetical protein
VGTSHCRPQNPSTRPGPGRLARSGLYHLWSIIVDEKFRNGVPLTDRDLEHRVEMFLKEAAAGKFGEGATKWSDLKIADLCQVTPDRVKRIRLKANNGD